MPQHARIEEVSDSDLGDSDPSEQDPDDFAPAIFRPSSVAAPSSPSPTQLQPQFRAPTSNFDNTNDRHKRYQCLYPLYFDANRTRSQGRRVGQELAVQNPLAREIVDAVQLLGLDTVFEPGKLHPKDWSNPGRVRVLIKEGGRVRNRGVKNSMSLPLRNILCLFKIENKRKQGEGVVDNLAECAPRAPSLHPRIQTSTCPSHHAQFPPSSAHTRHAHSRPAHSPSRRAARMEDERHLAFAFARAQRRWRQREYPQGYDAGDAGRAGGSGRQQFRRRPD